MQFAHSLYSLWDLVRPPDSTLMLILLGAVVVHVLAFTATFIALLAVAPKNNTARIDGGLRQ